ncbi:DUF1330 domain-containing protein [Bradyrhizobium sp. 197]|nr:DUF1330 domain-containing protein [Bradyrhizobium sp. 197]
MTAYFVVQVTVTDQAQYQKYREAVVPLMVKFAAKSSRGAPRSMSSRASTTSDRW